MHGSNNVEFMGVLVDRQYASSQKCVQLVFETAEGIRLSLSRNASLVRSLKLGLTYKVKGAEHTVGQKRYVHEPTATLVPIVESPSFFKRYKVLIPVTASFVVVLGGVGAFAYTSNNAATASQPASSEQKPAIKSATKTATPTSTPAASQSTADTAPPSSSQQQTITAATPSTKKTTSPTATKTTTPSKAVVAPAATTPPVAQEEVPAPVQTVEPAPAEALPPVTPLETESPTTP